jgi:hypothetical protein
MLQPNNGALAERYDDARTAAITAKHCDKYATNTGFLGRSAGDEQPSVDGWVSLTRHLSAL